MVVDFGGGGIKEEEEENVIPVWLKNDAQNDTQICWNPLTNTRTFKTNRNLDPINPGHQRPQKTSTQATEYKLFLGDVGRRGHS